MDNTFRLMGLGGGASTGGAVSLAGSVHGDNSAPSEDASIALRLHCRIN